MGFTESRLWSFLASDFKIARAIDLCVKLEGTHIDGTKRFYSLARWYFGDIELLKQSQHV